MIDKNIPELKQELNESDTKDKNGVLKKLMN